MANLAIEDGMVLGTDVVPHDSLLLVESGVGGHAMCAPCHLSIKVTETSCQLFAYLAKLALMLWPHVRIYLLVNWSWQRLAAWWLHVLYPKCIHCVCSGGIRLPSYDNGFGIREVLRVGCIMSLSC